MHLNTRMTVLALSDGSLALVSPIAHDPQLQREIEAIGPISSLIAPNLLHHLFIEQWIDALPEVLSYGPAGLSQKRPDLELNEPLGQRFDDRFADDLIRVEIKGMPKLQESLFYHRASQTLVVTDFCLHLPDARGFTGFASRLLGIRKQPSVDWLFLSMVSDRAAFRSSLTPLWELPLQRLSMCHHQVAESDPQSIIERLLSQFDVQRPG
ncbi:MAG TPA: hypothetical protein DCQ06_13595 [Myxococcales bacterium]|nr:hypothetical protein [Myxococcales bacterium]HAN32624.1 hypothetical protein [Myxococcales bacterium]